MKFRTVILLLLFCAAGRIGHASPIVRDGTFLLRQRKSQLDYLLKKSPSRRRQLAASNRRNLVVNQSEVGFQVYNFISGTYEYQVGLLVAEGDHCRIFAAKNFIHAWGKKSPQVMKQIQTTFDQHVFPSVTSWYGSPVIPNEFFLPDQKIFIFLTDIQDNFSNGYVAGYFDHRDIEGLFGNQKPVFFMDLNPGNPGDPSDKNNSFYRTLTHEFQHMVSFSRRLSRGLEAHERWLDEGFSMFAEFIFSARVGENDEALPPSPHYERFIENPSVNLFSSSNNSWFREDTLFRQYGASFLFVTYMVEKYGGNTESERQGFARKLIENAETGIDGLDRFLATYQTSLLEVFQNWTLACYINDSELNNGHWCFNSIRTHEKTEVPQLPVRRVKHYYAREASSFIGGDGEVVPNSIYCEEIAGDAPLQLKFSFASGMSPTLVSIDKSGAVAMRQMPASLAESPMFDVDLANLNRFFILPIAVKKDFNASEKLNYSFSSVTSGLSLYPVANPAFSDQFIIFLRSREQALLATPSLKISLNNLVDSPAFSPVDDARKIFVAHYRLPGNGRGQAICFAGEDSCSFSFSAAAVRGNEKVESAVGEAVLMLERNLQGTVASAMLHEAPLSMGLLKPFHLAGPFSVEISENASASLAIKADKAAEKIGLAMIDSKGNCLTWHPVSRTAENLIGRIGGSGLYCLVSDQTSPSLQNLVVTNEKSFCNVVVELQDSISGVNEESLLLKVDSGEWFHPVSRKNSRFDFQLPGLASGNHLFRFEFSDRAGNLASVSRAQNVSGPIALLEAEVYPNPCRGRIRFRFRFSSPVDLLNARAKIYDSAGEVVAVCAVEQTAKDVIEGNWNGNNTEGRSVANGLYFLKAKINAAQGSFKKNAAFAVLR